MSTNTPPPGVPRPETEAPAMGSAIASAMVAATRDLPDGHQPMVAGEGGDPGAATIDPGELREDGFHVGDFIFPEPSTVGYQAVAVLTQKLQIKPGDTMDMAQANRMVMAVAWIAREMRLVQEARAAGDEVNEERHLSVLLDYATGGDLKLTDAARAMDEEVPAARFVPYMKAATAYLKWVGKSFTAGIGAGAAPPAASEPPAAPAEEEGAQTSGSASSS